MSEPVNEALITTLERNSSVWKKLKPFYEARLAMLRAQNDGNLTHEQTLKLRGRIAEAKVLLSLGTDKPQVPEEEKNFKD